MPALWSPARSEPGFHRYRAPEGATLRTQLVIAAAVLVAACGDGGGTATTAAFDVIDPPEPASYAYTALLQATINAAGGPIGFVSEKAGRFAAPDSHAVESTVEFAGVAQPRESVIVIGEDAWYDDGTGWIATGRTDARVSRVVADFTSVGGGLLPGGDVPAALAGLQPAAEEVGAYRTLRYDLPADEPARLDLLTGGGFFAGLSGAEEVAFSIWLDRASGAVVKARLLVSGPAALLGDVGAALGSTVDAILTVELSAIDSPDIAIAAPSDVVAPERPSVEMLTLGRLTITFPANWAVDSRRDDGTVAAVSLVPAGSTEARLTFTTAPAAGATLDEIAAAGLDRELEDPTIDITASDRIDLPAGRAALLEFAGGGVQILQAYLIVDDRSIVADWRGPSDEYTEFLTDAADVIALLSIG